MDEKKNYSKLRDLASVGISNIIGTVILSIFWIFLASILEPHEYGEVGYYIAIANIASVIAFLGSSQTIPVYVAKGIMVQPTIYVVTLIASSITAIIIFLILSNIEISLYISIYVFGYVIFGLATQEMLGWKIYGRYSKHLIVQRVLIVSVALVCYYVFGLYGIILGYGLASLPYSILLYRSFKKYKLDFSILKPRFGFMMNSYGKDLTKILSRSLDKLLIFPIFGFAALGHYQLGYQVFIALSLLPAIVFQYTLPREASGSENKKLNRFTIIISAILATLIVLFSPLILPILFPNFMDSIDVIRILSFAIVPLSISLMFNSKFLAMEKSSYVIIGSLIFLGVQITGIFTLGSIFGINGVALATFLGAIFETAYLTVVNQVKFKKST